MHRTNFAAFKTVMATCTALLLAFVLVISPALAGNHTLYIFRATWGNFGSADGSFQSPYGIYVENDKVYVADMENDRVQIFSLTGTYLNAITDLNAPRGVAADTTGSIYVANTYSSLVQKYDAALNPLWSVGKPLSYEPGTRTFRPSGLAIDQARGFLYVTDINNNRVVQLSLTDGTVLDFWTGPADDPFSSPSGVTVDPAGNLYVVDTYNNRIVVRNFTTGAFTSWGEYGLEIGNLFQPRSVSYADGHLYIAEPGNNRVQKFTPGGVVVASIGSLGNTPGLLNNPFGLAAVYSTAEARVLVYVADTYNNRVQVFEPALAPTGLSVDPNSMTEGRPAGTLVGTFATVDPNPAEDPADFSYALVEISGQDCTDNAAFSINGSQLIAENVFDYLTQSSYTICARVTDPAGLFYEELLTIFINEVPLLADAVFYLDENSPTGTSIGTLFVTVSDLMGPYTFEIISSSILDAVSLHTTPEEPLAVELRVKDASLFDYETNLMFLVGIRVTDSKGLTADANVTINVLNLNEAITVDNQSFEAAETVAASTVLGTVLWSDLDGSASTTPTFSVTGGDGTAYFTVDASTGEVVVVSNPGFNIAVKSSYTLNLLISDNGTPEMTDTAVLTINITSLNDPPAIADNDTLSVPENSPLDTLVGTISASDPDAGQTLTFTITGGTGQNVFKIDGASGVIRVVASPSPALDFETNPSFTLQVTVTDNGTPNKSANKTFTIAVTNVNEAPVFNVVTFSVPEDAVFPTTVGTVTALDPEGNPFTFSSSDTSTPFQIDAAGVITLRTGAVLDYETTSSYAFPVTVTDQLGAASTRNFTINVVNVNEAPLLIANAFNINENAANNTLVGTVTAADPDHDTLTFTSIDTAGPFRIEAGGAIRVRDSAQLNYEALIINPYQFPVTVSDPGGLSDTRTYAITINNVNEAITVNNQTFFARETVAVGTVLGTVAWSDADIFDITTPTFSVTSGDGAAYFAVDAASGQVQVISNPGFNIDVKSSYTLNLLISDNGTPVMTDTAVLTIQLNRDNNPPVITLKPYSVPENSPAGTLVGTLEAFDPDGDLLSYQISGGTGQNAFTLNDTGTEIQILVVASPSPALDYETTPSLTLQVTVTDDGAPQKFDVETLTIAVINVNEAPVLANASFTLPENSPVGTGIGRLTVSDVDLGDTFLFSKVSIVSLPGTYPDAFSLHSTGDPRSIDLGVFDPGVFDYEAYPSHQVTVGIQVTDQGGLSATALVTVTLTDVNDAPVLSAVPPAIFSLPENTTTSYEVGAILISDQDLPAQTISLTTSHPAFSVSADGKIWANAPLDHESTPVISLVITATDNGAPPLSSSITITINVTDVPEAPVIHSTTFNVLDGSPNGTLVGMLSAYDPEGAVLEYTITGGTGASVFAIHSATGAITVTDGSRLDYLVTPSFSLVVRVSDGGLQVEKTITINVQPLADPAVTAFSGPATALSGTTVPLKLTITNLAGGLSGDYTARLTLPAGVSFASSAGAICTAVDTRFIDCTGSSLASFAEHHITISVQLAPSLAKDTELTISVNLTADPDVQPNNNSASLMIKTITEFSIPDQDFETTLLDGWWRVKATGDTPLTFAKDTTLTPAGGRRFLGRFGGNDRIAFRTQDLPLHSSVEVTFDLFVIGSWDGIGPSGPDVWKFSADKAPQLSTTFSNHVGDPDKRQTYSGSLVSSGTYPAMTGAAERYSLGYKFSLFPMDAVYRFKFTINHDAPSLDLIFESIGLQALDDESWGIDNLTIRLTGSPNTYYLAAIFR